MIIERNNETEITSISNLGENNNYKQIIKNCKSILREKFLILKLVDLKKMKFENQAL